MKTHVEFRSTAFPPEENGADEVNPGRFGRQLARFVAEGLRKKGFATKEPVEADWGWRVPIENEGFDLWIGCGNYDEYPEDGFLCFIEPHTPTLRRWLFWKIDVSDRVTALQRAIHDVLISHTQIRDIKWWTYDEFNRPNKKS